MKAWLILLAGVTAAGQSAGPGGVRHSPEQRYELFRKNLEIRGRAITQNLFRGINSLEDWTRRRPEIRAKFLDMLGLVPLPARTPLSARITGELQRSGYRVQNIVFQSRPGLYVTGNLYLPYPAKAGVRHPGIIYVSGHSPGPLGAKVDYQHHGVWLARHGYVAFLLDTIEFGEIPGIHHGIHNLGMWYWLSLGYTPAGVEVWNAIRALDYLETRDEVDVSKAGITGISGGGAITWYTAAADDRFQAAVPVLASWAVGPHVAGDVVRQNCDCIYFWNSQQLDLPIVGALIAPRPLKIINASKDGAFPPSGYEEVHRQLMPVYDWYGAPEKLAEFHAETHHADLPPFRKEAGEWLNRWLRGDATPFEEADIQKETGVELRVLDRYPPDAMNEGIHRSFIRAHQPRKWTTLAEWQRRRTELARSLREKVFGAFPKDRAPFATWKRPHKMWTERYADSFNVEFTTEESIRVHGQLFVPRGAKASRSAVIYVKGTDDNIFSVDYDNLLSALSTHVVLTLNPRAVDYPMDANRIAVTKMTAALLGGTLESMQLWDILRSIDFLVNDQKLTLDSISIYGRKEMGGLALHAAALDNRVSRVILDDPPGSHWQGPALLNVLRVTDLAEVAGMVAPREIVSLTPLPGAYEDTKAIFGLYGKRGSVREAPSLGQALRVWENR